QLETVIPAAPAKLAFTTATQNNVAGVCSTVLTVQSQDTFSNASVVAAATTVTLATTSTAGTFYSDSSCTVAIASATIAAGASSASFWYADTKAASPTLTASASGLTSATQTETTLPATPTRLVFTTATQTLVAGVC